EHRCEALACRSPPDPPAELECGQNPWREDAGPRGPRAHDADLTGGTQTGPRVVAMPTRECDQLVEDRRLLSTRAAAIRGGHLVRDCPANAHRKLHRSGVVRPSSRRRFLCEATNRSTRR